MPSNLTLRIRKKSYPVASYAEASRIFTEARDKSGLGASRWPDGLIFSGTERVAYVSYNGRVWAGSKYDPEAAPVYDNR